MAPRTARSEGQRGRPGRATSTVDVGTVATPATLNIGWNESTGSSGFSSCANTSSATGVLIAAQGTLAAQRAALNVGLTAGRGTANGTLIMGAGTALTTATANIGMGNTPEVGANGLFDIVGGAVNATTLALARGTLDFNDGTFTIGPTGTLSANTMNLSGGLLTGDTLTIAGGTLNFTGGFMSLETFNGLLGQNGVLAPGGSSPGQTTINGNYDLASAGTVRIEIFGDNQFDQLAVNGTVNLNGDNSAAGGGSLDIALGYSPAVGTQFTVLGNDSTDAVAGSFKALAEGASFDVAYGSQTVTFQISYMGGTGNDVVLTVTSIAGAAPVGLTVTGTAAGELLSGSVDADTISGLGGNDILTGGAGNDLFVFGPAFGSDRIMDVTTRPPDHRNPCPGTQCAAIRA
jgi:hypothetical protein